MSFQAMSLVASIRKHPEICVIRKCLLLCMANYADDKFELWPSYQTLADDACINRVTAVRHIKKLIEIGVISRQKRPINNTYSKSNIYRLEIVNWLKSVGYELQIHNRGFIVAVPIGSGRETLGGKPPALPSSTETLPSSTETLPSSTETLHLVAERHQPSVSETPNPIKDTIKEPVIETNTPILCVSPDPFLIFDEWCRILRNGATDLKFHKEQKAAVMKRLDEGYSIEDIKLGILGCSMTDFNMGRLLGKPAVFDDLTTICKSGTQLDRFIATAKRGTGNPDPYAILKGKL